MQLLNNINSFVTVKADNRLSEQSSEISSIKSTQADSQKAPIPEPLQPVSLNSEDPFSRIDRFIGNALNSSLGKVFTQVGEKEISDLQPTKIKTVQNLFLSEINNHIENGSANGVTQSSFENMINSASEASQSAHQAVEAILADMGSLGEKEKANLIHSDKVIQAGLKHLSQRIDSKEEDSLPEQMMEFLIETNEEDQITINFNEDNGQLLHSYTV